MNLSPSTSGLEYAQRLKGLACTFSGVFLILAVLIGTLGNDISGIAQNNPSEGALVFASGAIIAFAFWLQIRDDVKKMAPKPLNTCTEQP